MGKIYMYFMFVLHNATPNPTNNGQCSEENSMMEFPSCTYV